MPPKASADISAYETDGWKPVPFSTLRDIEVLSVLGDGVNLYLCRCRYTAHTIGVDPASDNHGGC